MKHVHRILAVALSVLLWFGGSIVSQAEESVSENDRIVVQETLEESEEIVSGNDVFNEENRDTENVVSEISSQNSVMNVEISTVSEGMFSFILDPQGLILATNAIKYNGAEFGAGNLFFRNEEMRYSNTSNYVEIINKGDRELKFTVTAVLNMDDDILLAEKNEFSEKEDVCRIYMAIKDDYGETPILINDGQKRLEITKTIPAAVDEKGTVYRFALTGACNTSDAWMKMSGDISTVALTWSWAVIEREELETRTYATDLVETENPDESESVLQEEQPEIIETVSGNEMEDFEKAESLPKTVEESNIEEITEENSDDKASDS